MKRLEGAPFDQWRDRSERVIAMYGSAGTETCGAFNVTYLPTGQKLYVLASIGAGWEHVSVSTPTRCPTWEEMSWVKRAFFKKNEWALEYHPPEAENINKHPFCLHLWRCQYQEPPKPEGWMVG